MEEELNENELEERFYSMLYYVDDTQPINNTNQVALPVVENAPCSTVRRYWRTPENTQNHNNIYQKIYRKEATDINKKPNNVHREKSKPKEEVHQKSTKTSPPLSIFKSEPQNLKQSIEIIETNDTIKIDLESSDEDEVIEIALPPKPTITIESSDEDDTAVQHQSIIEVKSTTPDKPASNSDRDISASPVPSIVSSVSDEFIRNDCIALNISSRHPDSHTFDFSLHGADLLGQSTPKRKKKKKNKEGNTKPTTPQITPEKSLTEVKECFATPKTKAKNKKQRPKSYTVSEKGIPNADVYDSDSNQSIIDVSKSGISHMAEKDVEACESYTKETETTKTTEKFKENDPITYNVDSSHSSLELEPTPKESNKNSSISEPKEANITLVDLTDDPVLFDNNEIVENIVVGNVSGFKEFEDYGDINPAHNDITKFVSTKIPAILYENLDFDNLKGKDKVCKNRRYSLTTLRAEMEKFYNESWGGENFNHREIQKNMSRDKSLWAIDPKDKMPTIHRRKTTCNYCNRTGHRDDMCRMKPPVCYMCGNVGHMEPRCPRKICVNCGSPNSMYSTMCYNCCTWGRIRCMECGQIGHPSSHCPDLWRRYHNTIDVDSHLEESRICKRTYQQFCSGCARRGHLIHTCRISLPFSGLPINSPYVQVYRPLYLPSREYQETQNLQTNRQLWRNSPQDSTISSATTPFKNDRNKRQSKSPTVHESHVNKKRNLSSGDAETPNSPRNSNNVQQKKLLQSKDNIEDAEKVTQDISEEANANNETSNITEKAPDFIPITSTNRDKQGQIIQDNEVSDTSDVITSARIYVTNEIINKLSTEEGGSWLKDTTEKFNVTVQNAAVQSFLSITGKLGDQELFQSSLREWIKSDKEHSKTDNEIENPQDQENNTMLSNNIPKHRNIVLRQLNKALELLKEDLGEPKAIYKELTYHQNQHEQLIKSKVVNPKQLSNNRENINKMLKRLNMVLLGQAGLADGTRHLKQLYSLQEKLVNFRQKKLSKSLRQEIGEHYDCIFTAVQRDDYCELLESYYSAKQPPIMKKKDKLVRFTPKKKLINVIPPQQKNRIMEKNATSDANFIGNNANNFKRPPVETTLMNKLVFYHRRLLKSRPNDSVYKKTKNELVRKLHSHIASLFRNPCKSSKALKKMKKSQEQAQLFLSNI